MSEEKPPLYNRTGSIFMNPADADNLRKFVGVDPGDPEGGSTVLATFSGMKVVHSNYIEKGTVLFQSKPISFPPIPESRLEKMRDIAYRLSATYAGVPASPFFKQLDRETYQWERRLGETILAWGKRLDKKGLLDNPDIRWAYQTEVWQSVFEFIKSAIVTSVTDLLEKWDLDG